MYIVETRDRLSEHIKTVRFCSESYCDKSLSQNDLAVALGVTKKTYQNYESGESCPDLKHFLGACSVCGVPAEPVLKSYLYPHYFSLEPKSYDIDIIKERIRLAITGMSLRELEGILYIMKADHGSDFFCSLQKSTADLQTPMTYRVSTVSAVHMNYTRNFEACTIADPTAIQPDLDALITARYRGLKASVAGRKGYTNILINGDISLASVMRYIREYGSYIRGYEITIQEIAKYVDVKKQTYIKYETGESNPGLDVFFVACDYCGVRPEPLIRIAIFPGILEYERQFTYEYIYNRKREIIEELLDHIDSMNDFTLRCFDFVINGLHGSSVYCYIQKWLADIQCQLADKLATSAMVSANYDMTYEMDVLTDKNAVLPDMEAFLTGVNLGFGASINGRNSYVMST